MNPKFLVYLYNVVMEQPSVSPIPYREETFSEKLNKKTAFWLPSVAGKIIRGFIDVLTKVIRFVISLIPEALGRN